MRVRHETCSTICGTPVQAILDQKNLTGLAGGVREGPNIAKYGPRFWLLSPLEAPKWVQDPGNGLKSIRGSWGDHLGSISGVLDPFRGLLRAQKPKMRPIFGNIWTFPDPPCQPGQSENTPFQYLELLISFKTILRQYLEGMIFQTLKKWTSCFVQVQNLFEERRKK